MTAYFIHNGHSQLGPFTIEQLNDQTIKESTPVWHEGLAEWTTVSKIPELMNMLILKQAPPPFKGSSTPPPFQSKTYEEDEAYQSAMDGYFPPRKKCLTPLILASASLVILIITWLIIRNNENTATIKAIENRVAGEKYLEENAASALNAKHTNYRNNWEKYIKFKFEQPHVDHLLGGISEFNTAIGNDTEYTLDQVDLQVDYIGKSGKLWERKEVTFLNVLPRSWATKLAPKSINGVRVEVKIKKIVCKSMQFCYPVNNGNSSDPYYCQ